MPEVRNVRVSGKSDPKTVYVGRPTKWGNPFIIGRDGTREEVVAMYRERLLLTPPLLESLHELTGKNLSCWCAPEQCHADVLLELANQKETDAL